MIPPSKSDEHVPKSDLGEGKLSNPRARAVLQTVYLLAHITKATVIMRILDTFLRDLLRGIPWYWYRSILEYVEYASRGVCVCTLCVCVHTRTPSRQETELTAVPLGTSTAVYTRVLVRRTRPLPGGYLGTS